MKNLYLNLIAIISFSLLSISLYAQPFTAPTFIDPSPEFCDGDELTFELTGLPDPSSVGNNDGSLVIELHWVVASTSCLGPSILTGVATETITSTTHTFSTGVILNSTYDLDYMRTTVSEADPFANEGGPWSIPAQNGSQCAQMSINENPIGSIALPGGSPAEICENGTFDVLFTATAGTGPFDLDINGSIFTGISSGGTVTLTEGTHFAGDGDDIELLSISDNNGCIQTGSPITLLTGPTVIEFDPGNIVASGATTICPGGNPDVLYGDGTSSSSEASGDGSITYDWESSPDNFTSIITTGLSSSANYNPGVIAADRYYRRKATSMLGSESCDLYSNVILITVNNVEEGTLSPATQHICPGTDAMEISISGESGDGTLSYEWFESTDNSVFTAISPAETGTSYTPTALTQTMYYKVEVTSTLSGVPCTEVTASVEVLVSGAGGTNGLIENISAPSFHCTIQDAIDDATSGDVIQIPSGTYVEPGQIVVDKNITLQGLGKAVSTLSPGINTGSSGDARAFILVNSGIVFHLKDLKIDGTGKLVYQAIRQKGEGTITDVHFAQIKFNESGPNYSGVAVAAFGTGNVDVSNSMFDEIGRIGILYFGTGISGSVFNNNIYTGKGAGLWLDYMLDISAGANVTVTGNTVNDNLGVAGDGSTSAGILVSTYFWRRKPLQILQEIQYLEIQLVLP